jgi:hypothetical protein
MSLRAALATAAAVLSLVACSSATTESSRPESALQASAAPSPAALPPSPSPLSAGAVLAPPAVVAVTFSGLPRGAYPVHVHSRCNGSQAFHIITVGELQIASTGTGAVGVPRGYFGRGLCLIVYTSPSLSAVLTTRPI